MPDRISLRCRCGALRGDAELTSRNVQRIVCYCDDCQAYAHFLDRADTLDEHGGSDIVQTRPSAVRLTEGVGNLACMRLSDKGMIRWYARCCRTPVGNTMTSARMPFVGLARAFFEESARLPAPIARVQGRFARGGVPHGAHATAAPGFILTTLSFLARGFLARGHRPSPFFDGATRKPTVTPEVLSGARS